MRREQDYYGRKAKAEGYPARSVYKLMEIQKRFRLLRPGQKVLDVGAAPGSWSQYVLEELRGRGQVVGLDLQEAGFKGKESAAYRFFRGDLFSEEVRERLAGLGPYDLVLSDAAPSTSGMVIQDVQRSLEIVQRVLDLAEALLKPGGGLVVKIFQGGEEKQVLDRLRALFARAQAFRPQSSRSESREVFYIGLSYHGRKKA